MSPTDDVAPQCDEQPTLTVAILTLNEEEQIAASVRSAPRGAELLLLDSGSSDATVERARAAAASQLLRVAVHPFTNYSDQRNVALGLVQTPWVLFLDADEQLTPSLRAEIAAVLHAPTHAGYWIPRRNYLLGRWMRHAGWFPDLQLRLLRRDAARYDNSRPVHECAEVVGTTGTLQSPLVHDNYRSVREFVEKQWSYAVYDAQQLRARGWTRRRSLLGLPARELVHRYVALHGYRDGWRGLLFSLLLAAARLRAVRLARHLGLGDGPTPNRSQLTWRGETTTEAAQRAGAPSTRPSPILGSDRLPTVAVVIVSWNVRTLLVRCLASVERELADELPHAEVWVIDNCSTDGSADAVAERYSWVRLIRLASNPGFAGANNIALRQCTADAALLLNPDAELLPGSLVALRRALRDDPSAGVVGPLLLNADGSVQSSRRRFPTLRTGVLESTLLQRILPGAPAIRRYHLADRPPTAPDVVDWVMGACMLVRRTAWESSGLLDEGFHMYSEELDWQLRMQRRGWRVRFEPAARVVHDGGQSSGQDALATHLRFHASKLRYYRLHHGRARAAFLRCCFLLFALYQFSEEFAKLLLRHRPSLRRRRLALLARVIAWYGGAGSQ